MKQPHLGFAALGLLASASSLAQTADTDNSKTIQEVLVTATRRAENVQKVPLSVDVVTPQELESRNLTQVTDLPRLVPGLQFTNAGQANLQGFAVRGVSTYAFADSLEQTVGVNIDGVPVGRPAGSFASLVDLERIEILQGPQGLLFGKNASAGLVTIYSAKPKFDDSFSGRMAFASRNEWDLQAAANMQLQPDRLALRLVGWSFSRDGFIKSLIDGHMIDDRNDKGGRARLRWQPNENLEVNLTGEYTHSDAECCAYTSLYYPPGSLWGAADAAQGIVPGFGNYVSGTPTKPGVPKNNYARSWNHNAALQVDYDIGGATLTSVTGSRKNEEQNRYDGTVANIPYLNDFAPYAGNYHQFTQEFRLTSDNTSRLRYVAGLFYYDLNLHSVQTQGSCTPAGSATCQVAGRTVTVNVESKSYAAFGEATYSITDEFRISAGARLSHDKIDGDFNRAPPPGANPLGAPFAAVAGTDYTNFSGRLGTQYDLDARKMLYLTLSTGYKGPGLSFSNDFSAATYAATGGIVKPETTRSAELGFKSQWLDNALTFNAALFDSEFKDFQSTVALPNTFPPAFAVVNADKIRTRGAQIDFHVRPISRLELTANVAYTEAEFVKFPNAACYREQTAATGCINSLFNLAGYPLTNAPKWSYNIGANYDTQVHGWGVSAQTDFSWKDKVYWQPGNPYSIDKAYGILNASVGLTPPGSHYRITGFARNLLKEDTFGRVTALAFGNGYVRVPTYDTQRVFGIAVNMDF